MARSVGILSKLRHLFPSSVLLLLHCSLIHRHLLFGLPLRENANQSYLNRLQRLQNKAVQIITDSKLRIRGGVEDTRLEAKDQGHKRKCSPKKNYKKFF